MHVKTRLTRTPSLVLDVRDWFADTFGTGPKPARPRTDLVVTAVPLDPATPWPRPPGEPLELVTTRTPNGMLGAFDRLRLVGGPMLRFRLRPGLYRLTVGDSPPPAYPLYQTQDVPGVAIPDEGLPATVVQGIVMFPGALYPFSTVRAGKPGPTLAWGAVRKADGEGEPGVRVLAFNRPASPSCVTDDRGRWAIVLDEPGQPPSTQPFGLIFTFPSGPGVVIGNLTPAAGQPLAVNQASLTGEARVDGRPSAGVRVTVDTHPGRETASGPDGRWQYFFPLADPTLPVPAVAVTGTAPDGRTVARQVIPRPGVATPVDPLTF